ncbi:Protein FAM189A1 [Acropora cervicornis]|uniref:Protein FAM189A1 n=1 Tax=Acropora cervicornis TaxID=6130 RepID=A0AAD9V8J9_ACRCE|nr:Protein FAM189A1 [Acropora cervicornis]
MSSQGTRSQQMSKIRQTTLGFGVVQILLGISLTSLSFTAFTFTSSNRIRNACPYWAGFTVLCSGGVGLIAWKNSTVMSVRFCRIIILQIFKI